MKCLNCNKEMKDDLKYCPHCGAKQSKFARSASPKKRNVGKVVGITVAVSIMSVITIGMVFSFFNIDSQKDNSTDSKKSSSSSVALIKNKENLNHQLDALDTLESTNYYRYSLTNGGKYLTNVYEFVFRENNGNIENVQDYENECDKKTTYEYYNKGTKDIRITESEKEKSPRIFYKMFDENGNNTVYKEAYVDSSGVEQISMYRSYHYNEDNKLTEVSDGSNEETQFYYDDNGNLTQKIRTNSSSYSTQTSYELTTDENNNIIEKTQFDDGQQTYTFRYKYEGDKLISESTFETDGTETERKEYEYENNNIITYKSYAFHSAEYYPENSFELEDEVHYEYDEDGFLISYSFNRYGVDVVASITYDDNHNIQLIERTGADNIKKYTVFEYNDEPLIFEHTYG